MNIRVDCLAGRDIGKLFVVKKVEPVKRKTKVISNYRCVCDCGKFIDMDHQRLTRQKNASCGCVVSKVGRPRR